MNQSQQVRATIFSVQFFFLCILGMMAVHEFGHIIGALVTGGTIQKVVLHPFSISRTDVFPNPFPGLVVWLGPIFGSLIPVTFWFLTKILRLLEEPFARFFAGFCLIANGLYLGVGCWFAIGDCREILRTGSPFWTLPVSGILLAIFGLLLIDRTIPIFGFGKDAKPIDWLQVTMISVALWSIIALGLLLSERI